MTWTPCPFWPECGALREGGCPECPDDADDEREEAYWENLSEDEWESLADEDEQEDQDHAGGEREGRMVHVSVPMGKVMARLAKRIDSHSSLGDL